MAFIDRAPRSSIIVADSDVECDVLTREAWARLSLEHPQLKIKILENLAQDLCRKLRKAVRQLAVLD